MKNISKIISIVILIAIGFTSCQKITPEKFYPNGVAPVLKASSTAITPAPSDSSNVVVHFTWSNPNYATDSATQKFILEIDSTGRNFSKEMTSTVSGALGISFTGGQLNTLLANFGFAPGQTFTFDIRVTSSYGNNNEQMKSNIITVKITSYLVPITLVPSSTTPLVLLVSNATSDAISFSWNASNYGSDNINYALQFDTVGGNFAHPQVIQYGNALTSSILVNDLNSAAIAAGVSGGSTKNVEFRVVSYLGVGYTTPLVLSSVATISITTFTPIPPNLYIVGDATPGGWSNPVPVPSQKFSRLDAVSYGIVINLTAGKSYLLLPLNGDWTHKYGGATDGTAAGGGALLADGAVPGSNTPAPATTGLYQIIVNFQTGKYTVTSYTSTVPSVLFIIGGATAYGWTNNSGLAPLQQFTKIDAVSFGLITTLTAGQSYLFIPEDQGLWTHKFGGTTDGTAAGGGALLADGAVPGSNTPAPATTGVYEVIVNFISNTYTVTPYTGPPLPENITPTPSTLATGLWIIGDATPQNPAWTNTPAALASQQFTQLSNAEFQITIALKNTGGFVFLPAAGDWGNKYGGTAAGGGALLFDGAVPGSNTPAPATAGNYLIDVNFITGQYTLTAQ